MAGAAAYDLGPLASLAFIGVLLAAAPLAWLWLRHRDARPAARLRALTLLTLFLTFDLVLFGAFTRLSDSGLGCPDWPGCYGSASPLGAVAQISAAQAVLPTGPVTHVKAWIEMLHRYLAAAVGVLITVLAVLSWRAARQAESPAVAGHPLRLARNEGSAGAQDAPLAPGWAVATLAWVCVQGAFGALTVTMKLYPAIVTAHLLGGLVLLVLLAVQSRLYLQEGTALPQGVRTLAIALSALSALQIALGGWVSTNYAALACSDFPTCQGQWWPPMDFSDGFALRRELGQGANGAWLPFAALTAVHYVHRLGAYAVLAGMALLAWRLHASGDPSLRRWATAVVGVAAWQLASGMSNVLLGWPLPAAVAHTAGAAAWAVVLATLLTRPSLAGRGQAGSVLASGALRAAP